jgi:hypothetical protein
VLTVAATNGIGLVSYGDALQRGLPVAKVGNAAGYFTAPTPGNIAIALTQAHFDADPSSPT